MNRPVRDLEQRKKELEALQRQLESKIKDIEGQMSSSSLLEKEIALEKLRREREQQAAIYSTILSETQDQKKVTRHRNQGFRGLMIHRRSFRNRILMLTGVLLFIVYLIYHAVK